MPRLIFSLLALLSAIGPFPTSLWASSPNVVLVMADDQGLGDMGYMGHPNLLTPHFDEASRSGVRFDSFYAAAPVCSPTRASVLTGRHPNRMGVFKWGYPMRPQELTIAEILKDHGYLTGHFGKWHLGSVRSDSLAHPGINGFDHWVSAPNFYDNDPILSHQGKAVKHEGESSMLAAELAMEWIDSIRDDSKPFLAVVWFGSPHAPHRASPEDEQLYADQPKALRHFFGEISGMDRAFGRIRDGLKRLGLRNNTVLWYCSDNGALPKVGSTYGYRGHKASVYEGGLRVPAFLEWPARFPQSVAVSTRCSTNDILPTVLEMAGLSDFAPEHLDGVSLMPWIGRQAVKRHMGFWDRPEKGISTPSAVWMRALLEAQRNGNPIQANTPSLHANQLPSPPYRRDTFPGHAAWIDGDLKLHRIESAPSDIRWELYDLGKDPSERMDLWNKRKNLKEVHRMQQDMRSWLVSVVASLNGEDYTP